MTCIVQKAGHMVCESVCVRARIITAGQEAILSADNASYGAQV